MVMKPTNYLPAPIIQFLMMDVYKEASVEDKEFLDVILVVAKLINSLKSPLSFIWFVGPTISKWL